MTLPRKRATDGGYYRFGVIVKDGRIMAQTLDESTGLSARYPMDLIDPVESGAW